jgi:hypothetical protein
LPPEKLDTVLKGLAREWASQHDDRDVQRAGLLADLATLEVELKNLTAALAGGAAVATVLDGLREREARKRDLRARLDALDAEDRAAGRASEADYLARFHTISNVRPASVRGFVNFISSAVMDVTIRR